MPEDKITETNNSFHTLNSIKGVRKLIIIDKKYKLFAALTEARNATK